MWIDELTTKIFNDDNVKVTRTLTSPATPDEMELTFSDGSRLFVAVSVDCPPEVTGEAEAANLAAKTTAVKAYGLLLQAVYNRATEKKIDADIFTTTS